MKQKRGWSKRTGMFPVNNNHSQILKSLFKASLYRSILLLSGCVFATHLGYCTALYAGIIQASLPHLQLVQNAAVYFSTGTHNHNIQPTGI